MKELAVIFAEGFEEIEALTPVDFCRRAGIQVDTVSLDQKLEVSSAHGILIKADKSLNQVDLKDYQGLYLPGGLPAAEIISEKEKILQAIQYFKEKNRFLFSICAGPVSLDKAGVLRENLYTCYPGYEKNLKTPGRQEKRLVQDGNLFTAIGPAAALVLAFQVIECFRGKELAEKIKKETVYDRVFGENNGRNCFFNESI